MAPTRIPGIDYAAMPKAGFKAAGLAWPPRWIVIHDTGNDSSNRFDEAHYAATRDDAQSRWTSAHAYTDRGGALGSLPLTLQAWAAFAEANAHGVHIEMCREANGVVHPDTVRNTTALVRTLLGLGAGAAVKLSPADVAAGKRGICGHLDITLGLHVGDHEDPGRNFDWASFMAQVTGGGDDVLADERAWVNNADKYGWGLAAMLPKVPGILADGKVGQVDNALAACLLRIESKVDKLSAPDPVAFATALAPLLSGHIGADELLGVLTSPEGQAALVAAANKAEDS